MEKKESTKWKWPERGVLDEEIKAEDGVEATPNPAVKVILDGLREAMAENIDYRKTPVLGFPGTTPHDVAVAVSGEFVWLQANNIGCHTRHELAENGFRGSQRIEREYVWALADLFGAKDPASEENRIDGYFCSGGTDGNFNALWVARNKLLGRQHGRVAVLCSFLTHYSIRKNCDQLWIGEGSYEKCPNCEGSHIFRPEADGSGLHLLPTNVDGELYPRYLERYIRRLWALGISRFIIVLNAGTINMGSIDPVREICELLDSLEVELGPLVSFYVHVDAAFGGFAIPFLSPNYPFGFHNPRVDSISVDVHKMGLVPYPAGVFLCRKNYPQFIERWVGYVAGHTDDTSCGSRPGLSPLCAWAVMQTLGRQGYANKLFRGMEMIGRLRTGLWKIPGVVEGVYETRMNILAVHFAKSAIEALRKGGNQSIERRYCVVIDQLPSDLTDPNSCPVDICRFVAMPHLTEEHIDAFLKELREAMPKH